MAFCVLALLSACSYRPFSYGFPGPHATHTYFDSFEFHGHDVQFTVYYPQTEPRATGCPIVVFSAGWNQPRTTNEALCVQLAQWGMVVINRQYPSIWDAYFDEHVEHNTRVLDWAIAENARESSPLFGMIDPTRAAAAGYSMGAGIAVGAAVHDVRFKACVAIDALGGESAADTIEGVDTLQAAALYVRSTVVGRIGGPADYFDYTPAPAMEVNVVDASHMQFEDRIVGLNQLGPVFAFPNGPADAAQTRAIATRYTVAWLKVFLEGDQAFWTYVNGEKSEADVAANLVTIRANLSP
jgi:dienelactone hydrolase